MGRFLVLLALVMIGVWLVRRALARADADPPPSRGAQDLVGCARCGMLVPRSEVRSAGGAAYCSEEHARLGPRPR
ncbi:MAG TPA: PP0621 family protein [Burkholderiales bacterium]|nr:PP0621 family protein [Burkholderiales bacterium]